jgi:hypothetical protein
MRNADAIAYFLAAADTVTDPLDILACRRVAAWLRWSDAFGATVTQEEAARLRKGGNLAELSRQILRRLLAEGFPRPAEDLTLSYLDDEESGIWRGGFILRELVQAETPARDQPRPMPAPVKPDCLQGKVMDPFAPPAPSPWNETSPIP